MTHFIEDTWPPVREKQAESDKTNPINSVNIGTVLAGREDYAADAATIKLLTEVIALRSQLRAIEPQLSRMIMEFGWRRGNIGYREFYLRNILNEINYKER